MTSVSGVQVASCTVNKKTTNNELKDDKLFDDVLKQETQENEVCEDSSKEIKKDITSNTEQQADKEAENNECKREVEIENTNLVVVTSQVPVEQNNNALGVTENMTEPIQLEQQMIVKLVDKVVQEGQTSADVEKLQEATNAKQENGFTQEQVMATQDNQAGKIEANDVEPNEKVIEKSPEQTIMANKTLEAQQMPAEVVKKNNNAKEDTQKPIALKNISNANSYSERSVPISIDNADSNASQQIQTNLDDTIVPLTPISQVMQASMSSEAIKVTDVNIQETIVSNSEIVQQLAEKVDFIQLKDAQMIKVQLKPDHLGNLTVSLERSAEGVSAQITTNNLAVREALAADMNSLKGILAQQNIKPNTIDIVYNDNSEFSSQPQQDQLFQQKNEQQNRRGWFNLENTLKENDAMAEQLIEERVTGGYRPINRYA